MNERMNERRESLQVGGSRVLALLYDDGSVDRRCRRLIGANVSNNSLRRAPGATRPNGLVPSSSSREFSRRSRAADCATVRLCGAQLGIEGTDVRRELKALPAGLANVFAEAVGNIRSPLVAEAVAHYSDFVTYAHQPEGKGEGGAGPLPTVQEVQAAEVTPRPPLLRAERPLSRGAPAAPSRLGRRGGAPVVSDEALTRIRPRLLRSVSFGAINWLESRDVLPLRGQFWSRPRGCLIGPRSKVGTPMTRARHRHTAPVKNCVRVEPYLWQPARGCDYGTARPSRDCRVLTGRGMLRGGSGGGARHGTRRTVWPRLRVRTWLLRSGR
eukprot:1184234-Prorocentrum_minimum.AAC.1